MNARTTKKSVQDQPQSHVTQAPEMAGGHNFDPRMRAQLSNEPKVVHAARDPENAQLSVSDENEKRREASLRAHPHLNLSAGEFVVMDVKRHPIGLLLPVLSAGVAILALIGLLIVYPTNPGGEMGILPSYTDIFFPVFLVMILIGVGGAVAVWVYLQNHFYLTNESVIQEIQHNLFSRHEQTVSLGSIEDASFKQSGVLQHFFDYGTVRLSTEGEETTYRFAYVANPRRHVAVLNNAVEAFKNGRPVDPHEN